MSTYFYLVDKENKIKMNAGKANKEEFLETAKKVKEKFVPKTHLEKIGELWDLDTTKFKNMEVRHIRLFCKLLDAFLSFDSVSTIYLFALFYFIDVLDQENFEWDYYCEYNEEKSEKYKDYKTIKRIKINGN